MAPQIKDNWREQLGNLTKNWDSYGANVIDNRAMDTVDKLFVVPTSKGGIQLETHCHGIDLEIEITEDGKIVSCLFGLAN